MDTTSMCMMTDIKIFINLLQLVGQCPECSNAITTTVDFSSKKGLAQKVVPSCKDTTGCAWTHSTYTSTMTKSDERSRYDVNIRSIIAFGEIRRGLSHIETFHRIMNMSPPYSHSSYDDTMKDVLPHYHEYGIMKVMENRTLYRTLQRGSESFCRISADFWSRVQGNRERYNTSKGTSCSKKGL